jgi:hypothetical protein
MKLTPWMEETIRVVGSKYRMFTRVPDAGYRI